MLLNSMFRQYKDVLSKNPAKPADPARSAGRNRRGVLSFGYLFFSQGGFKPEVQHTYQ